jgi:predicted dehydrogenase
MADDGLGASGSLASMPAESDIVRIGIVGAGNIASMNVAGYLSDPRCAVVAVCDPREGRAAQMAAEWGVPRSYTALDDLLADPDIDAVEILTPTNLHYDHVLAALAAAKHVSCQKPLANSVSQAREMARAAEEAGLILRVSECFRHYPPLELAKRLIDAGAIGKPTHLRCRTVVGQTESAFQSGLDIDGYVWRMTAESPGGHLFDDMIHKYAVALWLLDQDIVSVQAVVRRRDYYFEPCAAIFEYEDPDVLGSMEVSYAPDMWLRSAYYGADEFFEIQGDSGNLWVTRCTGQMLDLPAVVLYDGAKGSQTTTTFPHVDDDWGAGFRRASTHFVDALVDGVPAEMSADEAVKALQLCFAVYEAGNTRLPVDPRTIDDRVVPDGWPKP